MRWREAQAGDVPAILALLRDDALGSTREGASMERYLSALARIRAQPGNAVVVGEDEAGEVVATFQITVIDGLSLRAARRAQIESVRVASRLRRQGHGRAMVAEMERRAREAGCSLVQLTMNASRAGSRAFYEAMGFEASHVGFKLTLP